MSEQDLPERASGSAGWQWWTLLIPAAGVVIALASAPRPEPLPDVTPAQAERIAHTLREGEPALRRRALSRFPADPWSQADELAHAEAGRVRQLADRLGVRPGAVLRTLDADVRAHPELPGRPGGERGQVPPCIPRVYYH